MLARSGMLSPIHAGEPRGQLINLVVFCMGEMPQRIITLAPCVVHSLAHVVQVKVLHNRALGKFRKDGIVITVLCKPLRVGPDLAITVLGLLINKSVASVQRVHARLIA